MMPPKPPDEPSWSPRHVFIYDEDWEWLALRFGKGSSQPIGISPAIRLIVHRKIVEIKDRERQEHDRLRQVAAGADE